MMLTDNQRRVVEALTEVFQEKGLQVPSVQADTVLEQLGLESLDFAQVVIRMEEVTGTDPFATGADYQIRTLADFAALYE